MLPWRVGSEPGPEGNEEVKGVIILAAVIVVLGGGALLYMIIAKIGQKMFSKKGSK